MILMKLLDARFHYQFLKYNTLFIPEMKIENGFYLKILFHFSTFIYLSSDQITSYNINIIIVCINY